MTCCLPPVIFLALSLGAIYFIHRTRLDRWLSVQLIELLWKPAGMPDLALKDFWSTIWRILKLNWYSILMLVLLWVILIKIDVGVATIESYVENLKAFSIETIFMSLFMLFGCVFVFSMSIWMIPVFLYSRNRALGLRHRLASFYVGTKILSVMAITPFGVVSNAFLNSAFPELFETSWKYVVTNICIILVFAFVGFVFHKVNQVLAGFFGKILNLLPVKKYIRVIMLALIVQVTVAASTAVLIYYMKNYAATIACIYMFISSAFVFRILFSSAGLSAPGATHADLLTWLMRFIARNNRRENKLVYRSIFVIAVLWNMYYYFLPSLTETNSLYIIFSIFSLIVIYADFFRNLYQTEKWFYKTVSLAAFAVLLVSPALTPKKQFKINLPVLKSEVKAVADSARSLEKALTERIAAIDQRDPESPIYIICGMGGGSRAGFFTSAVLNEIDTLVPLVWDQTLCFSTISGSSPGVYHYFKIRKFPYQRKKEILRKIYQRNYNSAGVYGLLLGDPIEALFGKIATIPKELVLDTTATEGYFDRNYRLRLEYQTAFYTALTDTSSAANDQASLARYFKYSNSRQRSPNDNFRSFFTANYSSELPIHLINTFEVGSGRRTILSPFFLADPSFFPNALLPLQDTLFARDIAQRDIVYRDATNLSELFPFVSAVSNIGEAQFQFADGGNFENYGLATGLVVAEFLISKKVVEKSRIKIILIKNSEQTTPTPASKGQLLAPVIGALNAPFTGHANHVAQVAAKTFGRSFHIIEFEASKKESKVPLTRALSEQHILRMNISIKNAREKIRNITSELSP
jgi:hypothetical protein